MKRFLFLAATAAALLFSGCETPGDDNDNNQNNSENVDNGDNNNDNNDNNDNNGDKDDKDDDDPMVQAPDDFIIGTMWSTTIEYFDDNGNLTDTEFATIFFDGPNQVILFSQISDSDGNVIETDTITGTYIYEIPNITIYYSVDYGDEEGNVNYMLTGTVDGYVMTLSRQDSNGEVYTMTFTRE